MATMDKGLDFTAENLAATLANITPQVASYWLGLSKGYKNLELLLNGLSHNFGVAIPDEAWETIRAASKNWRRIKPRGITVK